MNPTRKHWRRLACFFLALFFILMLPASGSAQESTSEPEPPAESTELPIATPLVEETPLPTEEPIVTASPEITQEPVVMPEPVVTLEPEVTVAPEATVEPEATIEPEVTVAPEATIEPEVTVAPEATIEPEVTEEAEPEFVELTEVGMSKFPLGLIEVLELIQLGDFAGARESLSGSSYRVDNQDRVGLQIYPAEGVASQAVEARINRWNGRIIEVNSSYVIAYVPMNKLANLLENEMVRRVVRPPVARSTGPVGNVASEAFNLGGLQDWHTAGFTGQGVRIGVVDVGFTLIAGSYTDAEYGCLAETPTGIGGEDHGVYMLQTLCDLAPDASVFAYELGVFPYQDLARIVYEAMFDQIDVLVIAVDISDLAPGDGTGLEDGTDDPYEALAVARASGMVVFVSAGNYGQVFDGSDTDPDLDGTDTRGDRYMTFEVTQEVPGQEVARVYARYTPGDEIFISWNDWAPNGLGASDADNLEDFTFEVWEYDTSDQSLIRQLAPINTHEERLDLFADVPSFSFSINPVLTPVNGCVVSPSGGFYSDTCNIVVRIFREKGDSAVIFHMGITGVYKNLSSNREIQTADVEFVGFDGDIDNVAQATDSTLFSTGGTISRPADSPDVIAVGAVCANENSNFALDPNSSQGAIYGPNGVAPSPVSLLTQSNIKPDIVSFSYVSPRVVTSTYPSFPVNANEAACNGTMAGNDAVDAFGGTSAAAAHAAGMTAVMLSNPNFRSLFPRTADGVQGVQNYIQRRTVDLPLVGIETGYDYEYGAGLFILGSPDYNPANVSNPSLNADLLQDADDAANVVQCDKDQDGNILEANEGDIVYVGQANLESLQNGTLSNPYLSIPQAIEESDPFDCIVIMPGEYVTPILINSSNVSLYSYENATSIAFPATVIRVSGQYSEGSFPNADDILIFENGGIYLDGVSNTVIQGFTFIGATTSSATTLPMALPRQAIFADTTTNTHIISNNFGAVTVDGIKFDGFNSTPIVLSGGSDARVEYNVFQENIGGSYDIPSSTTDAYVAPVISVIAHGSNSNDAAVVRLNSIRDNQARLLTAGESYWSALVYVSDSYIDIVANTFLSNEASTMIYIGTNVGADLNEDIRIVSNLFQRNTMISSDTPTNNAAALVQISQVTTNNDLSFVNNSVVVNRFTDSGANGAILGFGSRTVAAPVGEFDFVNNMVYGNVFDNSQPQRIVAPDSASCIGLSGGTATRNNWWHNYGNATANCNSMTLGNGNRVTNTAADNPADEFIGDVLGRPDTDQNPDPLYYVLGVTDTDTTPDTYSSGVDTSTLDNVNDADNVGDTLTDTDIDLLEEVCVFVDDPTGPTVIGTELGNGIDMTAYPFDRSANDEVRVWDIDTWHNNAQTDCPDNGAINPAQDLDIGAFEFINLNILPTILNLGIVEDTAVIAINLDGEIEGGFGDLEFSVTNAPDNYGTQCGFSFLNTVPNPDETYFGVTFGTGAQARTFFYCPAPDFYTSGLTSPYPSTVDIDIRVVDEIGMEDVSTISINILPDTSPVPLDADLDAVTTFTSDDYVVIGNLGQQDLRVRLRPFVNFGTATGGNFSFSERSNSDFLIDMDAGVDVDYHYAIDYPFTYSALSVVGGGDPIFASAPILDVSGGNQAFVEFDLEEEVEGIAEIQYTVTDARGNSLVVRMQVRSISRIPLEPGIYDDSSFAFDYPVGTWSAVSEPTAINNTLHTTNTNNAITGFGFRGTGFTLYMKGQGSTGGGNFGLRLYIDGVPTATPVTTWTLLPGSTTIYQAIVSDTDTVFFCTTDAIKSGVLSSTPADYYAITCSGFNYVNTGAAGYDSEATTTMNRGVHLVELINLSTKKIAVDAFTLLDDNETPSTVDVPLRPGFHDVDELAVRDAFGSNWVETRISTYSNGIAYVLTGPHLTATATNSVSFHVNGGTGFAIGTTQESVQTAYTVCVTNTTTANMTCQRFDYIKPPTTPLLPGVFRPFYGLNPDPNITYRVDILPENVPAAVKFVLDSVVVFEPTDVPLVEVTGSVDNAHFESFVLGGGFEDSWTFATGVTTAFDGTLTTIPTTVRGAGPFIAFETDDAVDSVYWTTNPSRLSVAAMVCVDRHEGVGTNATVADAPMSGEVDAAYGNCIVVNLVTGSFWRVAADGSVAASTSPDGNIQLTKSTFILRESDFRTAWQGFDTDGVLTFEIFSIYDTSIALDRVVANASGVPLSAGRYEEYTQNIDYWKADGLTPATIGESESTSTSSYALLGTDFVQVFGAGAARDFAQGVMYTKTSGLIISFEFTGTGFAPAFRMMTSSEEVEVCWMLGSQTPLNTLNNGVCQFFDNSSRTTVNNGLRPILGLPNATYTVAIRYLGDNFAPARNTSLAPDMWFDGVVVYDDDYTTLSSLTNGSLTEGNFSRHEELGLFEYLGTGWISDTSSRARTFSSANADSIARGEVGATVIFETTGANAIVLTRNLASSYTPFLVCATEVGDYQSRFCQTIDSTARGAGNTITIYLTAETVGPFGTYIVTVTALTNGAVYFDAVTAVDTSGALTAGQYDDDDPHIIYNYGSRNLILNGDFESTLTTYWSSTATASRITGTGQFYTGAAGMNVNAGAAGLGITSLSFELQGGVTYTFSGHVRLTSGLAVMDGPCAVDPVTIGTRLNSYQPLRCTYTPVGDETVTLSFLSSGGAAVFNVDDVRVTEGATWLAIEDRNAFGGYRQLSTTHGAEIRFGIDGTGFGLRLTAETTGGRMMVCYKSYDPMTEDLQDVSFNYLTDNCITFENETSAVRADTMRIVEGLPSDTYAVMVRDMEDGDSVLRSPAAIRLNRTSVGQIRLDYILVFDTTAPAITLSGNYNESAVDGGGDRFLELLPADRWSIFSNTGFSEGSYASPIDANAVASRTTAGAAALLYLNGAAEARVVIDLKTGATTNSNQILACADAVDGIISFNHTTNLFEIVDTDGTQECTIITNLTSSRYIVLTPNNLEPLGTSAPHSVIIQALSVGTFTLDDYQVLFSGALLEGYYEESMVADIASSVTGTWTTENNPAYSGGSARVLANNQTGAITFTFTGTGISVIHGMNTTGGDIEVDITAGPVTINNAPITTDFGSVVYGNGQSFTGLPSGTYTVTITGYAGAGEKVVLDAIEIYGTLQTLGSIYDDNEVDSAGVPYLTYGPDNASWTLKTGGAAPTALNRTLHSTTRAGATLSFTMDDATGIILYYGTGTVTNPRVCFRNTGTLVETCPNPVTPMTTAAGNVQYNAPATGDYYVSITNTVTNGSFQVDAIQVLEAGLHEGIFDAADINSDVTTDADAATVNEGGFNATSNTIELATGDSLVFNMTGIAFSIIIDGAVNQDNRYTICVETDNTCDGNDIVNEDFRFPNDSPPSTGLSAISYAGLQDGNGDEQTVTVHITNNHNGTLRIKGLHILGQAAGINISDTARHENTASQISYLPFGSMVNTVVTGNRQSGGSEHSGSQFGEMVYFEITDLSGASSTGFEYVRQLSSAMTAEVEVCFGQIADGINVMTSQSSADARATLTGPATDQCFNFDNVNTSTVYQVSEIINTGGLCEFGCWVTIRNQQAKPMSLDYVRLFDAGAALTQGYYQDNYPAFNFDTGAGASWDSGSIANASASDGFVRQATVNTSIDNENGAVFWFVMQGTGFSIDFVNDVFADEVEICYGIGAETTFLAVQTDVLESGTCQVFDNQARATKGDAQRNVLGLPFGTYTVAVRMHRDNLLPTRHSTTASPIRMKIDGVEIYNEDWASLEELTSGNRYDTDYLSRDADNRFVYVGETWTTLEGTRARSNTGGNLDQVREYGGAIVFVASGADSMTLYTNLGRANTTFRICSTPVDAGITAIDTNPLRPSICQDFSTIGTGTQQPFSFRFRDYNGTTAAAYLVTISSMDDLIGLIDAVELSTTTAMTEGFYEGTNVNLFTDTVYQDYVYNGRMEVNGFWDVVGSPQTTNQSGVRYEGAFGWRIVATGPSSVGAGISSQSFALDELGVTYTAIARVKVTTGSVRLRLVQGNSQASITEFRPVSPTGTINNGDWITLRAEFQLSQEYDDLHVQVVANSTNSTFDVDDVHLYRGGLWTGVYNRSYSFGSAWQSQTAGSTLYFSFTGTGFELGTEFGTKGGEMELCYDTNNVFGDVTDSCFTYQNEARSTNLAVSRTIAGLPFNTYFVRIRDDEDGRSGFRTRVNSSRLNANSFARITVDYLRVFGANSVVSTPASFFNQNATDSLGNPYLQLYPSAEWAPIAARAGTGYSGNTYQSVIDSRGRTSRSEAGQSAVLYVDVPDEGATVVLYTGPANRSTSTQFLACAGDEMSGRIDQAETKVGNAFRVNFFLNNPSTPADCVLLDGTLGTALAVGPNDLAALGTAGSSVRVTFTTLTVGQFIVDGFQVIHGNTLTAGVYDSFMPDNLLNFNSSNSTSANRAATGCNPDFNWCTVKVTRSFGDTVLSTQDQNANLTFNVQGTGFSILTNIGAGARMRICYTQTPLVGDVSFPAENASHNNATQDLSLGGFWCETVTTNTSASLWNASNTDRRLPARGPQYGFAYYGLPFGNYSVQVLMLDGPFPATSSNALQIDAIVVFSDYNDLDVMGEGFYDNTEASVSFEPFTQWTNTISRSGPPRGPYNLTETTTTNAGAIMQMQVDGNSVTLFQTLNTRNTADARICMVVTMAVIHCTRDSATTASAVQNPPATPAPYALAFELANFSQSSRTSYFAPIMFYGLGSGDHTIIIENRDHTKTLSFDAILIQE